MTPAPTLLNATAAQIVNRGNTCCIFTFGVFTGIIVGAPNELVRIQEDA